MAWGRLDDSFHDHPKTVRAGLAANGLLARAISYAAKHQTDGRLPVAWVHAQVADLPKRQGSAIIDTLIREGQLETNGNGEFLIHNYLKRNPSRAEIEKKRAADRQRKTT